MTETTLTAEQIAGLRDLWQPLWSRHGSGLGRGECAFCAGFLVSRYGVVFPNPHRDGCGYVAICNLLGLAP